MAAELPYMQFYPADHLRDTRILSLAARGAWMDLVCAMWHPRVRGVLSMRLHALARLLGATFEETEDILAEFIEAGVADVTRNGQNVTIACRRIMREWQRAAAFRAERSESGRRGAEKRWRQRYEGQLPLVSEEETTNQGSSWLAVAASPASAMNTQAEVPPKDASGSSDAAIDTLSWHGLDGDEALALLGRHFPDRDVWGEYQRFKQIRAAQGRKPDWRGLIAWLRKAAPVADLSRPKPSRTNADPPGWPAWIAETYPKADTATRFADAPDDVRREFLASARTKSVAIAN